MNGLSLRITGGGCKMKNPLGFEPVSIPSDVVKELDLNEVYDDFLKASHVDNQLAALKSIVMNQNVCDPQVIRFLVVAFLQAEPKHPAKSFISRCVTKNKNIEEPFSKALTIEIKSMINCEFVDYKGFITAVSKLATCVENFPAGTISFRYLELPLQNYLKNCLFCCVNTLRETKLSPSEKNELFNLAHLTLRLLLYIVQKVGDNKKEMVLQFQDIRCSVRGILYDHDAPMDTKSVCGMLLVAMHVAENNEDSWIDLLSSHTVSNLKEMFENDAAKLSIYSALATVIPAQKLHTMNVGNQVAVIVLVDEILAIGERMSAESTFTLSVTRTLVQISKSLDKSQDLDLKLIDKLLVFVWAHLEHYMDSVRHLTAQMLNNIVRYSAVLKNKGYNAAVDNIFTALNNLDRHRKSFYLTLTSLSNELGAGGVMQVFPDVVNDVVCVLHVQAVQASATTFLEVLLKKHMAECPSEVIYDSWVQLMLRHVSTNVLESSVINILENLLTIAVKDEGVMNFVLPYIKQTSTQSSYDLKCVLLLLGVVRKSRGLTLTDTGELWRAVLPYTLLNDAAVDVTDETRILSLSLIVESPKTTEMYTKKELDFVLYFLKYNCNAQAPHFRQLTLSLIKKFIKRLEDSYKVLKRTLVSSDYYLLFIEKLREQCFSNLLRGANYGRRFVALQTLGWLENMSFNGYQRTWKEVYVDRLLIHLEDSYENNKMFALDILETCPKELLQKKYSISLKVGDILREASSVKPTDCTNAAYKLLLLRNKCTEYVLGLDSGNEDQPERVSYILLNHILTQLSSELSVCEESVIHAARDAPMYGLVHCARYIIEKVDAGAISADTKWTGLIHRMINVCLSVNNAVSSVVNNSSPEGHLPMDMEGLEPDQRNNANACLQDGRPVTAQMVLLCAWRSVKEVSLFLGSVTSHLTIDEENGSPSTITSQMVQEIGAHFTTLLAETKHRGAFEQAYVGFTKLLSRLWRCSSPELHELPKRWLTELLELIQSGDNEKLCATRRSAGLPFMIQALVITELQVTGNAKCFGQCMQRLLGLARHAGAEARTHATNILRALFRNAGLHDAAAPRAGDGLLVALGGFDGTTWQERNSSTLLLSALLVRIFGVSRSRADASARNRMTGRIFFLRYPALADFMLNKLNEANEIGDLSRPSVYPILLLLSRLYPSALEGTVSNLKLASLIPAVCASAGSAALGVRRLAARALLPLVSPDIYISHVESTLKILADPKIKRNRCHGIILQLIKLFEAKPDNLHIDKSAQNNLTELMMETLWIVEQTLTSTPCYLLTADYVKMIDLFISRFPAPTNSSFIDKIKLTLYDILFNDLTSMANSSKEVCLSNVAKTYFRILNINNDVKLACTSIEKCLKHKIYEVVLVILNYLLALHGDNQTEYEKLPIVKCNFMLCRERYTELLCDILRDSKYLECKQLALKILVLEDNTQNDIIRAKLNENISSDTEIIASLLQLIETEHQSLTHCYLRSLTSYLNRKLKESSLNGVSVLEAIRVILACSYSDNNEETREVVVEFLEVSFYRLLTLDVKLDESDLFEYKASIMSMVVILLEDDEQRFRQRIADIITNITLDHEENTCTKCYKIAKSFAADNQSNLQEMASYQSDLQQVTSCTTGNRRNTSNATENKSENSMIDNKCEVKDDTRIHVIPSKAVENLMKLIAIHMDIEILCVLALLDFKSEVCMNDEINDECRVFDQNERYNIFSEEVFLTAACVNAMEQYFVPPNIELVNNIVDKPVYTRSFNLLCHQNLTAFKNEVARNNKCDDFINPKIELFIKSITN